jgi:hypothetical protein
MTPLALEEDKNEKYETDDHTFVVSNMVDHKCTVMELHMRKAWPTLMSDLLSIFVSSDTFIEKSESESKGPFMEATARFWMTSTSLGGKLSRDQMEHIQTRVINLCRSRTSTLQDELLRARAQFSSSERLADLSPDHDETRSVSNSSAYGIPGMQKTPSKLTGMQQMEGMEQVPPGAFIIPAGAVVMMPAGSQVQYVNNRANGVSEPERERTPETGENRIAL